MMLCLPATEIARLLYLPTGGGFSGSATITVAPVIASNEPQAEAPTRAPSSTTTRSSTGSFREAGFMGEFHRIETVLLGEISRFSDRLSIRRSSKLGHARGWPATGVIFRRGAIPTQAARFRCQTLPDVHPRGRWCVIE